MLTTGLFKSPRHSSDSSHRIQDMAGSYLSNGGRPPKILKLKLLQLCYCILPAHYLMWWKYVSRTIKTYKKIDIYILPQQNYIQLYCLDNLFNGLFCNVTATWPDLLPERVVSSLYTDTARSQCERCSQRPKGGPLHLLPWCAWSMVAPLLYWHSKR